jgi:hypothetical protein
MARHGKSIAKQSEDSAGEKYLPVVAGEKVVRSGRSISPHPQRNNERAWRERGQPRWSPVLVRCAVSEDPRWTRAVGAHLARSQGRREDGEAVVARCAQWGTIQTTSLER